MSFSPTQTEGFTQQLELVVRESGYNAAKACNGPKDENYSRAIYVYELACTALRNWCRILNDPERANRFINGTFKPW